MANARADSRPPAESVDRIIRSFANFDTANTGKVRRTVLKRLLARLGVSLDDAEAEHVVSASGCHGDAVDYTVFTRWIFSENHEQDHLRQPSLKERTVTGLAYGKGNLNYLPSAEGLEKVRTAVAQMEQGNDLERILVELREARAPPQATGSGRKLLVCFTDLEPDDTMAVAQLWQRRLELGELDSEPLIIFLTDFESKDGGTVFHKKLLVAYLMLGHYGFQVITREKVLNEDHTPGPLESGIRGLDTPTLDAICERISSFGGDVIDFFVMAPGLGKLADILGRLKAMGSWPLRPRLNVSMYTGSYNMRGMTELDISALHEMVGQSSGPLVDCAKFAFFGGKDPHEWADSLTTFALPDFAAHLSEAAPMLAAALKALNDELNTILISPHKTSLFKGSQLTDEEKNNSLPKLIEIFDGQGVNAYAKALEEDIELFGKVAGFKKSTVVAFAFGGCDSPLCDQLLFLSEWLRDFQPTLLSPSSSEPGTWVFDQAKGFTSVDASPGGVDPQSMSALRPLLAKPKDEPSLWEMRGALETYLRRHLDSLKLR